MTLTTPAGGGPDTRPDPHAIGAAVDRARALFESGAPRTMQWRERQLRGLLRFAQDHTDDLIDAMATDLGRPAIEAWGADVGPTITEVEYALKRFRKWASPRRARVSLVAQPGTARIVPEPLGVALIIAPWNYPVNLVLEPMAAAFAAGNVAIAKPSEYAPATTGVISRHLPGHLDDGALAVFEGGAEVSTELLRHRFDHIFFTGSTEVGRIVMRAAAEHLTPVTLELGGKSPAVIAPDADLAVTANRIAWGKCLNAGQTCIAPDYALVPRNHLDELVDGISAAWARFYGSDPSTSPDLGRIVSPRHHERLVGLLDGHDSVVGGRSDPASRYFEPTIVVDPALDSALMTEEIFGPILPVIGVDDLDEAIEFVNDRPKPLALYAFGREGDSIDRILDSTSSGGVCVNHTLFHFAPNDLPFGGVGASGMGRYHGRAGFEQFSNMRGILRKPIVGETNIAYPPYTDRKVRFLRRVT